MTRAQLQVTRGRALTVARLHKQLYRTTDVSEVELGCYLRTLVDQVRDWTPTGTELEVDAVPAIVATDRAVPIALIVNELVTNAVKHARARHIVVRVEAAGDHGLRLSVSDDGVGLPVGFDPCATGASLGMRIITSLVRQLGASLRWASEGDGARFTIGLPPTPQAAARGADA